MARGRWWASAGLELRAVLKLAPREPAPRPGGLNMGVISCAPSSLAPPRTPRTVEARAFNMDPWGRSRGIEDLACNISLWGP